MRALSPDRAAQRGLPATTQGVGGSTSRPCGRLPSKHRAWDSNRTTRSTSGQFTVGRWEHQAQGQRSVGVPALLTPRGHFVRSTVSGVQALGEFTEAVRRRRGQRAPCQPPGEGGGHDVRPSSERAGPATRPLGQHGTEVLTLSYSGDVWLFSVWTARLGANMNLRRIRGSLYLHLLFLKRKGI